jgi:hypothetical protein
MNTELWDELSAANRKATKLATANKQLEQRVAALEGLVNQMALALGLDPIETESHLAQAA